MLKLLQQNQDQWPQVLPGVLFAYRTSKQSSTGFSPFFLLYGRTAKLPIECYEGEDPTDLTNEVVAADIVDDLQPDDISQRLRTISAVRVDIAQTASENILLAQDRQKRAYKARNKCKFFFTVGDKVLLWNLRRADRKGGKMTDPWLGPYIINSISKNGAYELRNENGDVLKSQQHSVNLKLFLDRGNGAETDCSKNQENITDVDVNLSKKRKMSLEEKGEQSSEVIVSNAEEVEIIANADKSGEFSFTPTQVRWRTYQSMRFSLSKPIRMEKRSANTFLGIPTRVENVAGDGNCFFRAISREMGGKEDLHRTIRDAVVSFMRDPGNQSVFEGCTGRPMADYISGTAMNANGTWATDTEIVATATLLQTTMYIYTAYAEGIKWLRFEPLFIVKDVLI